MWRTCYRTFAIGSHLMAMEFQYGLIKFFTDVVEIKFLQYYLLKFGCNISSALISWVCFALHLCHGFPITFRNFWKPLSNFHTTHNNFLGILVRIPKQCKKTPEQSPLPWPLFAYFTLILLTLQFWVCKFNRPSWRWCGYINISIKVKLIREHFTVKANQTQPSPLCGCVWN